MEHNNPFPRLDKEFSQQEISLGWRMYQLNNLRFPTIQRVRELLEVGIDADVISQFTHLCQWHMKHPKPA